MRKPVYELMLESYPWLKNSKMTIKDDNLVLEVNGNKGGLPLDGEAFDQLQAKNHALVRYTIIETIMKAFFERGNPSWKRQVWPAANPEEIPVTALCVSFHHDGHQIYKMAKGFTEQLIKVDLNVAAKHLPTLGKMICIEMPDSMSFQAGPGRYVNSFFVATHEESSFIVVQDANGQPIKTCKDINIVFPVWHETNPELRDFARYIISATDPEQSCKDMIAGSLESHVGPLDQKAMGAIIYFVIICLVYINSGNPDLRAYRKPRPPLTKKAKKLKAWAKQHENLSMVDMTLVGFDFKKPRVYQVGEVSVIGHFRWQPYGPQLSKVKLIWIEPYTKHLPTLETEVFKAKGEA